jgi:uncharacterized repeat protein (TIGR02543 family)
MSHVLFPCPSASTALNARCRWSALWLLAALLIPLGAQALTVANTNAVGQIVSIPAGIQCGNGANVCTASFPAGTMVALSVIGAGLVSGTETWSAPCPGLAPKCVVSASTASVSVVVVTQGSLFEHFLQISANGDGHTCAIDSLGAVKCWGDDSLGQLGDGAGAAGVSSPVPVAVSGLTSGIIDVVTGASHACALNSSGGVVCWGKNDRGQLGNGGVATALVPTAVTGLSSGVVALAAGGSHTCALTTAGGVLCWGDNSFGQIGNNAAATALQTPVLVPTAVSGLASGVVQISAGADGKHSCALTAVGGAMCWGSNNTNQLGGNTGASLSPVPVTVVGLASAAISISAGSEHSCAVLTGGDAQCWGSDLNYGLGDNGVVTNSSWFSLAPVQVSGLTTTAATISSAYNSCAITTSRGLLCWGLNGFYGLGTTGGSQPTPQVVPGFAANVGSVSTGPDRTCVITSTGVAWCFGRNAFGDTGTNRPANTNYYVATPTQVYVGSAVQLAVTAGGSITMPAWLDPALGVAPLIQVCPGQCLQSWSSGTAVPFTAVASAGYAFAGWSGNCAGTAATCTLTVNALLSATASFNPIVTVSTTGSGVVTSTPAGINCGVSCSQTVSPGTTVTYSASASAGSVFIGWTGTACASAGLSPTCTFAVNAPATVTANFSSTPPLSVNSNGVGTITSAPAGINCTASCTANFALNSTVVLTATAAAGNAFTGWSGACSGTAATCSVTMSGVQSATANFIPTVLTTISLGRGTVSSVPAGINCSNSCSATFPNGTASITLTATAAAGYQFTGWSGGGCSGRASCVVSLGASVTVWANFSPTGAAFGLAAGANHACAVTAAGAAQCWGNNADGELGNNSKVNSPVPIPVSGLASGVLAVAAGTSHSCALTTAGAVQCWGANAAGQLGNGSTVASLVPVAVSGLSSGVIAIAAGGTHTCALNSAGAVRCWGTNPFSAGLGDGTANASAVPVAVSGLASGVSAIAAGGAHSCALLSAGTVSCWGYNVAGQLGNNSTVTSLIPVPVSVLASVAAITAGDQHSCALSAAGAMVCWGLNSSGQLGNNSLVTSPVPVGVSGLASGVAVIAAGTVDSCAITSGGALSCWGANASGQLGDAGTAAALVPMPVTSLSAGALTVAVGAAHVCAIKVDSGIDCWGLGASGQLGNNATGSALLPVAVTGFGASVQRVAAGAFHSCALATDGSVQCWGLNTSGQLGNGTLVESWLPAPVSGLASSIAAVVTGDYHSCALSSSGAVQCWGSNSNGQLGNNSAVDSSTPVQVAGLTTGVRALTAGAAHTCALLTSGALQCWGSNVSGQLGNTAVVGNSLVPVAATTLTTATAVSAGRSHTCALTTAQQALCWGDNSFGELGNNSTVSSTAPVAVSGLSTGVVAISAGGNHSCAVTVTGTVLCWGDGSQGAVGDNGNGLLALVPAVITGLASGGVSVVAGGDHSCALNSAGGVLCWGDDSYGQLGAVVPGLNSQSFVPLAATGLASGVGSLAAGLDHTCAVLSSGVVQCFGANYYGGLGTNSNTDSVMPLAVGFDRGPQLLVVTSGPGAVIASPVGVSCGNNCYGYPAGTVVTLSPQLLTGASLTSWGGACSGTTACKVTISQPTVVSASFIGPTLTVNVVGAGTVQSSDGALICFTVACPLATGPGQVVTLLPTGGTFIGWSGACAGTGNCTVAMSASQSVTANFAVTSAGANVGVYVGVYSDVATSPAAPLGNVVSLPAGINCVGSSSYGCSQTFPPGLSLTLTATPAPGFAFAGWSGDCTGSNPVCTVTSPAGQFSVLADATFNPVAGISLGIRGLGGVISGTAGVGLDCGTFKLSGCSANAVAVPVTLHAFPDPGQTFAGWTGAPCPGTSTTCVLPANFNGFVTATFGSVCMLPAVSATSTGTGTIDTDLGPLPLCDLPGQAVNLHAEPAVGSVWTSWDAGRCKFLSTDGSGTANATAGVPNGSLCNLSFPTTTETIGVNFALGYEADGVTIGSGGGTVSSSLGGMSCPPNCTAFPLTASTPVTLSALPAAGATFAGWEGACSGTGACVLDMRESLLSVSALFTSSIPPVPLAVAPALSAGNFHTCALASGGIPQCWGANSSGQLGDGTTKDSSTPVAVSGLAGGALALAGGGLHSCAVNAAGGAICWGNNVDGELGNGTLVSSTVPVPVSGLTSGVMAHADGASHSCALTSAGSVLCWGANASGQLGNGGTASSSLPVAVQGLSSGVIAIAAGDNHSCALTTLGTILCWGFNAHGELGTGTLVNSFVPVTVTGLPAASPVVAIAAAANHNCLLTAAGGVQCWGSNASGQIGNGTLLNAPHPAAVTGLTAGVAAIAARGFHSCALTTAGAVQCWGQNAFGELGNGTLVTAPAPVAVTGLASGVVAIATGYNHSCALTTAAGVQCWGDNANGQLGNGTLANSSLALAVSGGQAPDSATGVVGVGGLLDLGGTLALFVNQVINFPAVANQTLGTAPPALVVSASSGLAVTLVSATPTICTLSGTSLKLVQAGTCTLQASQSGNAIYAAAEPVQRSFAVATAVAVGTGGSGDVPLPPWALLLLASLLSIAMVLVQRRTVRPGSGVQD